MTVTDKENCPMKTLAVVLCAAALTVPAFAAPAKPAAKKTMPMVTVYKADKCGMYFTPAEAKADGYACPHSKGKMTKMMMTPAAAKKVMPAAK